jgi:hypothetical protein
MDKVLDVNIPDPNDRMQMTGSVCTEELPYLDTLQSSDFFHAKISLKCSLFKKLDRLE